MFESLALVALAAIYHLATSDRTKPQPHITPGLRSQRSQIQPVAPSKQPYLGPKRTRSADFYRNRRVKKAIKKLPF